VIGRVSVFPGDTFKKVLVISPHLDDGVFACGSLLAAHPGAVVLTVFAGQPPRAATPTPWDRSSGFTGDRNPIAERKKEDASALSFLGARPVWLNFLDAQYGRSPALSDLLPHIERASEEIRPDAVFIPLGLFHSDHTLAHEAALSVRRRGRSPAWYLYEEAIYRRLDNLRDERLAALSRAGLSLARRDGAANVPDRKRKAVACYRSQLRALSQQGTECDDIFHPEAYWKVL
jgi:LmbE family N-acetylglucosaminyl deacetylase